MSKQSSDSGLENWEQWSEHLSKRKNPRTPWQMFKSGGSWPLGWAIEQTPASEETQQLVILLGQWAKDSKKQVLTSQVVESLENWLVTANSRRHQSAFGLECLAWSYLLPKLAGTLSAAPWHQTLEYLVSVATETPDLRVDVEPLAHQWLAGELALTLAYQFPELDACNELDKPACQTLTAGIEGILDGNGWPRADCLEQVRPLLAIWTRCQVLALSNKKKVFRKEIKTHFDWFVRCSLQLTRETGSPVFSDASYSSDDGALLQAAIRIAGDKDDVLIADQILPDRADKRRKSKKDEILPLAGSNSEWARISILQPSWIRGSHQLMIAETEGRMKTEFRCGEETIWSGDWTHTISIDGQQLDAPDHWEEVCWHSDDDLDYFETQAELNDGWILQRQVLLAREDLFLYIADAITGKSEADIFYRSSLPLCPGIETRSDEESSELYLRGRRKLGLVMPLALPEWRAASSNGDLTHDTGLSLVQQGKGQALYAPLFIDLNRKRFRRPYTWRQLTVAERLEIQPADRVAAFRVQADDQQWLFYRSLIPAATSRTVLGENLNNDFLAARFDTDGDADELIRIDPE